MTQRKRKDKLHPIKDINDWIDDLCQESMKSTYEKYEKY